MHIRLPRFLVTFVSACCLVAVPAFAEPQKAQPALWVMRDTDTTIYLFGSVHQLPEDLVWFDGAIADAFNAADELRLEAPVDDDPAALMPLTMQLAVDPDGRTMAQRLSPEDYAAYVKMLTEIGLTPEPFELMEPWFVGYLVATLLYAGEGYDLELGVEMVLNQAARKDGKTVTAFETAEQQLTMLDSVPEDEQLTSLRYLIHKRDEALTFIAEMIDHWAHGDPDEVGRLVDESMKETPEFARILITDRNRGWAAELKARLERPGIVFVAVGAGHLAGKNSVQKLLMKDGLKLERVAY